MNIEYNPKITELPLEERPREKLKKYGPRALKNSELLAVILGRGTKKEGVLEITNRIMKNYGNEAILNETNVEKLKELLSLNEVHACQIIASFELGRRLFSETKEVYIRNPNEVFNYLRDMGNLNKEHFRGLYLDVKNKIIHDEVISIGTLDRNIVHPRDIFHPAVKSFSAGIILAHNHPSGDTTPSEEDIAITKRMVETGKVMGIDILDHVILGKNGFTSLKEEGLI